MSTNLSILAWKSPWTEEAGGLQSIMSQSWTWLSDQDVHFFPFNPSQTSSYISCSPPQLSVDPDQLHTVNPCTWPQVLAFPIHAAPEMLWYSWCINRGPLHGAIRCPWCRPRPGIGIPSSPSSPLGPWPLALASWAHGPTWSTTQNRALQPGSAFWGAQTLTSPPRLSDPWREIPYFHFSSLLGSQIEFFSWELTRSYHNFLVK